MRGGNFWPSSPCFSDALRIVHPADLTKDRFTGRPVIELCQRAGSKAAVQGSISTLGSDYLIGLTASRCDSGEAIAHEQIEANRKEDVIAALGVATTRLRTRLGESLPSVRKYNEPLEQATTSSLDALKSYGMAFSISDREGDRAALPFLKRAIELDPGFAMAYGQLAVVYQNLGETQLARQNASLAFERRERTTASERLLIESWYNSIVTGNLEKATELLEIWTKDYPPAPRVLNDLAVNYGNLGRYEKAVEALRESIHINPADSTPYSNLATSLIALNRIEEAGVVLSEAEKHNLHSDYLVQVGYWRGFLLRDKEEMERMVALSSGVPGARSLLLYEQGNTEAYFGRFAKARQFSESAADLMVREGDVESAAGCLAEAAVREIEIGDTARAHAYVAKSLHLSRSGNVVVLAALALARIGDSTRARVLFEEVDKTHPADTMVQKYWLPTIRAEMVLQQGNSQKALDALIGTEPVEQAAPSALTISTFYPAYLRGQAYLVGGEGPKAAVEFQKLIDHPGMVLNFPLGALAHLGRARAYKVAGDFAKAHNAYRDFFELWKDADPDLPILRQARAEFSSLR